MIHPSALVLCPFCSAVLTRDSRAEHYAWHARLNARTHSMADPPAATTETRRTES